MKPTIFEFTDYRAFLKAFYEWKKTLDARYSYATFAERAGLKSRSYLRLVIMNRRNLSIDAIPKFVKGTELDKQESAAFQALVHFNQATNHDSRKLYWEHFLSLKPTNEKAQRIHDEYQFLARMGYPLLLILIRQPHVLHNIDGLSHLTGMTPKQVTEGIETLANLGAVTRIGDRLVTGSLSFQTADDMPNVAIQSFHKNMLGKAAEAVSLPTTVREFQSTLVPLNREEFLYVQKKLRDLATELDAQFSGPRPKSERVYAINLNMIPLTPEFIRKDKVQSSQSSEAISDTKEKVL